MPLAGNMLHRINHERGDHFRNPYPDGFQKVDVPEGESGNWMVTKYTVTEDDVSLFNLRLIRDGQYRRIVPPGTYTRLSNGTAVVMTDTPAEAHEHYRLIRRATGRVLLNGLGLGFALAAILRKPGVESVTVVEKSDDVLALVGGSITDPRATLVHADALQWRPKRGERFDTVWHDIWTNICEDNKPEMTKLRRAYAQRCEWQSCWSEEYL